MKLIGNLNANTFNGVALSTSGLATNFLNEEGNYTSIVSANINLATDNLVQDIEARDYDASGQDLYQQQFR
jgi:hypothetical protein